MNAETRMRNPVLCVDHEPLHCEGLRARLEREPDLSWAGWTGSCENVVAEAQRTGAKIVVIETMVNGGDPFEAIRDVVSLSPGTRVLVLSSRVQDRAIEEAMNAGACGYFSKQDDPDAVIEGVRTVLRGERAFGPTVRERCVPEEGMRSNGWAGSRANHNGASNGHGTHDGQGASITRFSQLTQRERDVLRMIGQGMTRCAIAKALHRSPKTVDCHRATLMEKLGVNDRVELARYAIREGLADVWVTVESDRAVEIACLS